MALPACLHLQPFGAISRRKPQALQQSAQGRNLQSRCIFYAAVPTNSLQWRLLEYRLRASLQEETVSQETNAVPVDGLDDVPLNPPKPPKFKRFIAQTDAGRAMAAYRRQVPVQGGELFIHPLSEEWLAGAADVLSTCFSDAMGYLPAYNTFLRNEVYAYLQSHANLPPKAVVLVGIFRPEGADTVLGASGAQGGLVADQAALESSAAELCGSDSENGPATLPQAPSALTSREGALGDDLSTASDYSQIREDRADPDTGNGTTLPGSASSSSKADGSPEGNEQAAELAGSSEQWSVGGAAVTDSRDDYTYLDEARSGRESLGTAEELDRASDPCEAGHSSQDVLVGTVELSFSPSTRTPALTLNPPATAAYLCNMAVRPEYQRRGFGLQLLEAAEQMVQLASFRRIYLHLRLKDAPARALYARAGYEIEKEDCALVWLLGQDRRQLLSKFIPLAKSPFATRDQIEAVQEIQP